MSDETSATQNRVKNHCFKWCLFTIDANQQVILVKVPVLLWCDSRVIFDPIEYAEFYQVALNHRTQNRITVEQCLCVSMLLFNPGLSRHCTSL